MENQADKKASARKTFRKKSNMTADAEETIPSRKKKPKAPSGLRVGKSRIDKIEKRMPKPRKWYTNKKKED